MADLSSYASAQSDFARRRKMAEMLQQQAFQMDGTKGLAPGAKMSWTVPLAQIAQAYAGRKAGDDITGAESAFDKAQSAQRDALDKTALGTPAQPEIPGTPDISGTPDTPGANEMFGPAPDTDPLAKTLGAPAPPPAEGSGSRMLAQKLLGDMPSTAPAAQGGPGSAFNIAQGVGPEAPPPLKDAGGTPLMIPQRGIVPGTPGIPGTEGTPAVPAKPPTAQELMDKGLAYMKLGDPTSMALGKLFSESGMKGLEPQTQQQIAAQALTRENKGADIKMKIDQLNEQARRTDLTESNRMEINRQRTELEREWRTWQHEDRVKDIDRKAAKGAGGGGGSMGTMKGLPVGSDADTKEFVFRGPKGELFTTGYSPEGVFEQRPYRGNESNILLPGDRKLATAAAVTGNQADMLDSYAKRLQDPANKDAFSTRANAGTDFSNNVLRGFGKEALSGVPAEKQQLRAEVTRTLATVVQSLMGAAVSPTEAARNAAWMPQPGDDADELRVKLQAASAEARKRLEGNAPKVNAAAAKPSAAPRAAAPAAAAAPAGNVEAERKRLMGKVLKELSDAFS